MKNILKGLSDSKRAEITEMSNDKKSVPFIVHISYRRNGIDVIEGLEWAELYNVQDQREEIDSDIQMAVGQYVAENPDLPQWKMDEIRNLENLKVGIYSLIVGNFTYTIEIEEQLREVGPQQAKEVFKGAGADERLKHDRLTCKLNITTVGNVFLAEMEIIAFGELFHVSTYQAKTEEELRDDFEYFKSGFRKFFKLASKKNLDKSTVVENRLILKEVRVMSGIHPYFLAERMGISLERLKRIEEGTAKLSLNVDQAQIHFQSTYNRGMMLDWIDWSLGQQKAQRHCNDDEPIK